MSNGRLQGKVAIITGGAGGIGSSVGRIFCAEGAKVALIDRDSAAIENTVSSIKSEVPGAQISGIYADLEDESAASKIVDEVLQTYNGIDVLVNNVAIRATETIADAQYETWDSVIRVNLLSYVFMARAAMPALRQSGHGSIINVSSVCGLYGRTGGGPYDAMKSAILAFTRTLAWEESAHGIRANSIVPGYTRTPIHVARMGAEAIDAQIPPCAMRRRAQPDEIAYPILFLASDEASYVNGATLCVDGGFPGVR